MGEYYVKIDNGILSASTLELDRYYISNEYTANPNISVKVSTNYTETKFKDSEGEIDIDDCLKFSGETEINKISPDECFKISSGETNWNDGYVDDWLSAHTENVSTSGGGISISIAENTTLNDRKKEVHVKFKDKQKKIIIEQYADSSYITYSVISNAQEDATITFYDKNAASYNSAFTFSFNEGYAEYSRRKIGSGVVTAKIENGLPESSVTYSINTADDTKQTIIPNNSGSLTVDLVETKTLTNYSWDEDKLNTNSIEFNINPNEIVTKNYYNVQNVQTITGEGHFTVSVMKNNGWLIPSKTPSHKLDYSANTALKDRTASVIFRLVDDQTKSLNYKITQSNAKYDFKFDEKAIAKENKNVYELNGKTLIYKNADFESTIHTIKKSLIISLMNGNDFVDYTAYVSANDNVIKVGNASVNIDGNSINITTSNNVNLNTLENRIVLTQNGSGQILYIKLIQKPVVCKVGDVYCYTKNNGGQHSFIDLEYNNIPEGTSPVGVVVLPMKNNAKTNQNFARIVSLTEVETNQNTGVKYGWYQDYDPNNNISDVLVVNHENILYQNNGKFDRYDGMSGCRNSGTYHNRYDKSTGLYYYNDDRHLPLILDSHDYVTSEAKKDYGDGDKDKESAIRDFDGYGRTYRLRSDIKSYKPGKMLNMIYSFHSNNDSSDNKCWFIGSIGEMAAVFQNISTINATISQLRSKNNKYKLIVDTTEHPEVHGSFNHYYSDNGDNANYYWTSTYYKPVNNWNKQGKDYDRLATWAINMASGNIRYAVYKTNSHKGFAGIGSNSSKNCPLNVRPMLMINEKGNYKP